MGEGNPPLCAGVCEGEATWMGRRGGPRGESSTCRRERVGTIAGRRAWHCMCAALMDRRGRVNGEEKREGEQGGCYR